MEKETSSWIRLRYIITLLGEYHNWWPAKVISGKGEEFLDYVLPKTKRSAVLQLATEICKREHDNNIGPGRYHIFRLPQKWEEEIFNDLKNQKGNLKILTENELMNEMLEISSGISISPAKGPLMVGTHDELHDKVVFQSIAKHYYEAFKNDYRSYPYLN
ncbi:MAG: BrxE family protein [Bacteroidetes bacterium]|nr:BrxE family protein [Bacteroidota bacterium]